MKLTKQILLVSGRRKTAIARAVFKPGRGRVFINGIPLEIYQPELMRLKIMEPLLLAGEGFRSAVDINVDVKGGGFASQAVAARMAIAKGLVKWFESPELEKVFLEYDRHMLVGDPRQAEPKKPRGRSARAKRQKSYR
ncbi:MAG: 30S ribosomal protein S9 [Candidatus Nezhaarchaeota archaeon]|nr:30S ribosomal protein S9 [Candidatus Nezhaarchaeota archaeon]